jgi:two-component system, chemotaxis family, chemotaxis protein CheY
MADVLIVDDDADIRQALRTLLEDIGGHHVLEANDGLAALDILRSAPQHLVVLLDLLMPDLDGLGVLRAVAADARLSSQHAYLLVTVSRQATASDFADRLALAVPVIPKPFDIDLLLSAVADAEQRLQGQDAS